MTIKTFVMIIVAVVCTSVSLLEPANSIHHQFYLGIGQVGAVALLCSVGLLLWEVLHYKDNPL